MKTYQFKTNINCGGCIATVKPFLDNASGIEEWSVDTALRDKILTVQTNEASPAEIIKTVEKAGFKIEPLQH